MENEMKIGESNTVDHLFRLAVMNVGGEEDVDARDPFSVKSQCPARRQNRGKEDRDAADPLSFVVQSPARRQRKGGHPSRLPVANQVSNVVEEEKVLEQKKHAVSWICTNSACKAKLSPGDSFCKRCACCICHQFDENKDPSLWIVCTPQTVPDEYHCELSCHIQCALDRKVAGVVSDGRAVLLDGSYRCESCGKISNLIGYWKKQLLIAKEARRVDILCHRLSLSHKLLDGTHLYKDIHEIVDKANRILACEVGSIAEGSAKLARSIVSRLSSWSEVQKLIELALEKADLLSRVDNSSAQGPLLMSERLEVVLAEELVEASCRINFENVSSASIVVSVDGATHSVRSDLIGYKLWHRKACELKYSKNPTCIISRDEGKALISNLQACTEYVFRVIPFSEKGEAGYCEARCFTKSIEVFRRSLKPQPCFLKVANYTKQGISKGHNVEIDRALRNPSDLTNYFKLRELQSTWVRGEQSTRMIDGMFQSSSFFDSGNQRADGCEGSERYIPPLNVFPSPGAEMSRVEDRGCNPGHIGLDSARFQNGGSMVKQVRNEGYHDKPVNSNTRSVEERSTVRLGFINTSGIQVNSTIDSNAKGLIQGNGVSQACQGCVLGQAEVIELDDASDPGISLTPRGENDASPDASGSVGANVTTEPNDTILENVKSDDLESNGHGESWAVQVRREDAAIHVERERGMIRKRTVGVVEGEHNCYGLMNGCTQSATGTSICAAKSYEYCVRIVRWLECEGHLTEDFRMKFLTWFSLRATEHQKRVLNVFIDTFQDNPRNLAEQLIDTFEDIVYAKRQQAVPNGVCNRLWH